MRKLFVWLKSALRGDRGATMVEYALLIGLIVLALIGVITAFGQAGRGLFVVPYLNAPPSP